MSSKSQTSALTPLFIFLLFTATLGPLLFGYHLAELNAPQQVITCAKKSINQTKVAASGSNGVVDGLPQCIPMIELQFGLVSSSFTLGGLLGALAAGPTTGRYGRVKAMLLAGIFAVIGPIFEALAPSVAVMTLGRFLSGIAAGASTVVAPIYIGEIAPPAQRGFFGTFTQVMINVGILIAQIEGLYLSKNSLWRIILAVAGAIGLFQILLLLLAGQESPTWLADKNQASRARRILQSIRGRNTDTTSETSTWSITTPHTSVDPSEQESLLSNPSTSATAIPTPKPTLSILTVLLSPIHRPAVLAVVIIMTAQQFTGINSIVMYGVGLLSDLLGANAAALNAAVSAVNVALTIVAAPLVERAGRRACLLLSMAGMGSGAVLLGIGIRGGVSWLCAVAVVVFVASFGLGLGPVPFILAGELVGSEAVGAVQSWALAANWIATFVVAQFFPVVNAALGKGMVYFLFAGFAVFFIACTVGFVPETKGKSDADEVWGRKKIPVRED